MRTYSLPASLESEINQLQELIEKFKKGEVSATELKAHRVPFGVYEQREPDTYMVRIRCAGGIITPGQLENVALIASQYGVSDIHITSRQELQIHYVKLDNIIAVIRRLKEAGLATRGGGGNTVRNIALAADAGIDPNEEFDVSGFAVALTSSLIAESDSWNLPRKFKIAFSGSREDRGYATIADAGFVARIKDGKNGFRVYAAGGLGAKPETGKLLLDFVEDNQVYQVDKAVKNIFYKYGNRKNRHAARTRFLWQSLGEEEFKKRFLDEYEKIKTQGFAPLVIDKPQLSPVSGSLAQEKACNPKDFSLWRKRFVRAQKQPGVFSILIPVELGFISCERSLELARFLQAFGDDVLRMTHDQNFLLRNIPDGYLGNIYNFLKITLPDFNRPAIYAGILSCAGASTCQLGICLSRQAARALMRLLDKSELDLDKLGEFKLNISGCPNSCGQHPVADLGFSGKALRKGDKLYPAYNVLCGALITDGRIKLAEQAGEVPAKALPKMIKEFLGIFLSKASRFQNFQEYIAREGKEDLKELLGRYREIPDFEQDKNYYFDWDTDKLFSLAERRTGECSAGLFDLIEMDLGNIRETRKKLLTAALDKNIKKQILGELVFYSSRMLLITRGIEPKNEEELYTAFLDNFIDTGLIETSFKGLIIKARQKDYAALLTQETQVDDLSKAVELLYENMDNAFNFKNPASIGDTHKQQRPRIVRDFRGVACPLNFVKTKIELSKLKPGDLLEIWLDDGEPIINVPGSLKAEGQNIVSQEKTGNYWSVVIEKK